MTEPDPRVVEGMDLLRAREWYAAHDAFERAWLEAEGRTRKGLQALIHLAVSFEHLRRGNPRGALSQWQKAQPKLEVLGPRYCGVDVAAWRADIARFFAQIDLQGRARGGRETEPLPEESEWPVPPPA